MPQPGRTPITSAASRRWNTPAPSRRTARPPTAIWKDAIADGMEPHEAQQRVVDHLIAETVQGVSARRNHRAEA